MIDELYRYIIETLNLKPNRGQRQCWTRGGLSCSLSVTYEIMDSSNDLIIYRGLSNMRLALNVDGVTIIGVIEYLNYFEVKLNNPNSLQDLITKISDFISAR